MIITWIHIFIHPTFDREYRRISINVESQLNIRVFCDSYTDKKEQFIDTIHDN